MPVPLVRNVVLPNRATEPFGNGPSANADLGKSVNRIAAANLMTESLSGRGETSTGPSERFLPRDE